MGLTSKRQKGTATLHYILGNSNKRYRIVKLIHVLIASVFCFSCASLVDDTSAKINSEQQSKELKSSDSNSLNDLVANARLVDPAKNLDTFVEAWNKAKLEAIDIYGMNHPEVRYIEAELAYQYYYSGEFKKALNIIEPITQEFATLGESYQEKHINLLQMVSPLYTNLGMGDKTIAIQKQVLAFWQNSDSQDKNRKIVSALNNLSTAKLQRGDALQALEYTDQALEIVSLDESLSDIEPYLLYNRTNYLSGLGLHNDALQASREGIIRMAELGQQAHLINGYLLTSLAAQLHYSGRYKASIGASKASIDVIQKIYGPKAPRVYQIQTVLLGLLISQGNYQQAIELANQVMPLIESSDGKKSRNYLFFSAGKRRAEFLLNPSITALEAYGQTIDEYELLLGKANRFSLGDRTNQILLSERIGLYAQASTLAKRLSNYYLEQSQQDSLAAKRISIHAMYYDLLLGDASLLDEIYEVFDEIKNRFELKVIESDKSVTATIEENSIFQVALKAAITSQDVQKAFEIAQIYTYNGARSALSKAQLRQIQLSTSVRELMRKRQDLMEQEAKLKDELDLASQNENLVKIGSIGRSLNELKTQLKTVVKKIEVLSPSWLDAKTLNTATLSDFQATLKEGEALFMPIVLDDSLALITLTSHASSAELLSIDALQINHLVTNFRRTIAAAEFINQQDFSEQTQALSTSVDASHQLYQTLFTEDVNRLLEKATTLYVSTNRYLSTIPFAALVSQKPEYENGNDASPRFLVDDFAVISLPSINASGRGDESRSLSLSRYVGIGASKSRDATFNTQQGIMAMRSLEDSFVLDKLAPLDNAEKELITIAKMNFVSSQLLIGESATESAVKQLQISPNDIVVFASHGLLAGELIGLNEPALVLNADAKDDGILSASEIAQMDFPAGFIVLSACNTGGEGSGSAEGLSGLASSFFYAGANSLMVSHWPIRDDAAAFLTVNTLQYMQKGLSKAQALRQAMLDLKINNELANASHPAIWASFSLVTQ